VLTFSAASPGWLAVAVWPKLAAWFEQRAAQILEQPQAADGHGEASPAGRGPRCLAAGVRRGLLR